MHLKLRRGLFQGKNASTPADNAQKNSRNGCGSCHQSRLSIRRTHHRAAAHSRDHTPENFRSSRRRTPLALARRTENPQHRSSPHERRSLPRCPDPLPYDLRLNRFPGTRPILLHQAHARSSRTRRHLSPIPTTRPLARRTRRLITLGIRHPVLSMLPHPHLAAHPVRQIISATPLRLRAQHHPAQHQQTCDW